MGGPMETPTDAVPARGGLGAKLLLSEPYAIDEKQIGELHCNSA